MSSVYTPVPVVLADRSDGGGHTGPDLRKPDVASGRASRFRRDVQGLRAVAVLLVVACHAGVPGLGGGFVGLDVFFVISGFVVMLQLRDEVRRTGRVRLVAFLGRRLRRVVPAAAMVIVVTVLAARAVLPSSRVDALTRDVGYAVLYGTNVQLQQDGVPAHPAVAGASPLQHFWGLALGAQLVAALAIAVVLCLLVRRGLSWTRLLTAVLVLVSAVSLGLGLVPAAGSSTAYYSLSTRAWEFGVGALLAVGVARLARLPTGWAAPMTWIGLGLVVASAGADSPMTPYPGATALLPVVGTGLLISAGSRPGVRNAITAVLEHRRMQYIGKVSYGWYLWHWPLLILLPAWAGREFGWLTNLEISALAFWAAVLTYFVEDASRRSLWSPSRWVPIGVALSASALGTALLTAAVIPPRALPPTTAAAPAPDASASARPAPADAAAVRALVEASIAVDVLPTDLAPSLGSVALDTPVSYRDRCHALLRETRPLRCTYGKADGTRTMVLVGDTQAQQWLGALIPTARRAGWRLVTYTKEACTLAAVPIWNDELRRLYTECGTWRKAAFTQIRALKPDVVLAAQTSALPWKSATDAQMARRTVQSLRALGGPATRVVHIGEVPQTKTDPTRCLAQHQDDASACAVPRKDAYAYFSSRRTDIRRAVVAAGISHLDPLNFFCSTRCPAVVDGMLTRRDEGRVTNTYATWLAPIFEPIFEDVTP